MTHAVSGVPGVPALGGPLFTLRGRSPEIPRLDSLQEFLRHLGLRQGESRLGSRARPLAVRREHAFLRRGGPSGPSDLPKFFFYEEWAGAGGLSADGHEMFFSSNRPGSAGSDLWVARFNVPGDPDGGFHNVENLGSGVNTGGNEGNPSISRDGHRLYFSAGPHFYVAARGHDGGPFENRVLLSAALLGGGHVINGPAISADERTAFWSETDRLGGHGSRDIWMATREQLEDDSGRPVPFTTFANVGPPVNTKTWETSPSLTADWPLPGSSLYFVRNDMILRAAWHPDCNRNQVDDREEIAAGDAEDADGNGAPDECDR